MKKVDTAGKVEDYLAAAPPEARAALEKLRKTIRAAAPEATEGFSYGMPAFKLHGRPLILYAAFKNHCSIFPTSTAVMDVFRKELDRYETSKGTIRFPATNPLPATLVKKLVKARIKEIEKR